MHFDLSEILRGVVSTEKTTLMAEKQRKYTFRVDKRATKKQIKKAIETYIDGSQVVSVHVINVNRKKRVFKNKIGHCSSYKKAIVTVKEPLPIGDFRA